MFCWAVAMPCRSLSRRIRPAGAVPGLPFDRDLLTSLGMIPNEYLYYYYQSREAVANILAAGQTRGEQIAAWNGQLFAELARLHAARDLEGMRGTYSAYLEHRGDTYMSSETGRPHDFGSWSPDVLATIAEEGYAGVALDLIEGLIGARLGPMVLNVANRGAIEGMGAEDVVEVPAYVGKGTVRPIAVGKVPIGPLGLMQQVKAYERLTIAAATEGSYAKAVHALAIHPLVRDYATAKSILEAYRAQHGAYFPALS